MRPPRVLVTRAPGQGSALAEELKKLGAEPVLVPAIAFAPPDSFAALDAALDELKSFDWLLFTSANAVEAFHTRLKTAGSVVPEGLRVAVIGPATAQALAKAGLLVHLMPPQAVAESLAEALLPHARQPDGRPTRFLLVRAEEAREHLPETLRAAGAEVVIAPAYRTVIPPEAVARLQELFPAGDQGWEAQVEAITFTSSSTARHFVALCQAASVLVPNGPLCISVGPITSQTLRELGLQPDAEAAEATMRALAEATVQALAVQRGQKET